MFFKGPLSECSSNQFLKIMISYSTINSMMICVVVDMRNWCYCALIEFFITCCWFSNPKKT